MTQPFTVVVPERVTETNLIATSVLENDHPVYASVGVYALGQRVILTTGYHMVYESLQAGNTGNFPPTSPDHWVEVGPTNAWAAFDESGGTETIADNILQFEIFDVAINAMAFLGVQAKTLKIELLDSLGGVVYEYNTGLVDRANISDWYTYFTAKPIPQTEQVVFNIPSFLNSRYRITLTNEGQVKLGTFVMGLATEFGFTQYNATIGIRNFGRTEVDDFGRRTYVRRGFAKRMNVRVLIKGIETDTIVQQLADLRDRTALYVGANQLYESLTIFGSYRDFSVDVAYPTQNLCSIEIEGVV